MSGLMGGYSLGHFIDIPETRVLIAHPHDGHGLNDTCFDCLAVAGVSGDNQQGEGDA